MRIILQYLKDKKRAENKFHTPYPFRAVCVMAGAVGPGRINIRNTSDAAFYVHGP
jgi:hypothetical protein